MSLSGTISNPTAGSAGNKDLVEAYQPILVATITFANNTAAVGDPSNATVLRLSTHPLNTAEGGVQYGSHDYLSRLLQQNIDAVQAMSDTGIDIPPTVSLQIADADKFLWTNYEMTIGFKGAELDLDLILWEVDTSNFSSDSYRKFTGTCDPALIDEATLTLSATSKLNMQKILLPLIAVQTRCPWIFPTPSPILLSQGAQMRFDALNTPGSQYFPCGYSPDQSGGRGNTSTANQVDSSGAPLTDSAGNFVQCDYTAAGCALRGMYKKDSGNHQTGHFGGVQWDPPLWWKSKSYLQGKTISGINAPNDQRYSDYVPLIYGQVFVDAVVLNVIGDANSTRMEALVCFGNIGNAVNTTNTGGIQKVIVNGVLIPWNNGADPLFTWRYVNWGNRDSMANTDAEYSNSPGTPYSGLGDPYGSLAVIEIVCPIVLVSSQSVPTVQILTIGPAVRVWYASDPGGGLTDPTVPGFYYLNVPSSNPIWVLMNLLIQAAWTYAGMNIQSFINAAAVCVVQISYTNNAGVVGNTNVDGSAHMRYSCSLAVTKRRTAADVIQGIRNCCKAMLIPNDRTGLLQVFIKQSLAGQQPAAIPGSNSNTQIPSLAASAADYTLDYATWTSGVASVVVYGSPPSVTTGQSVLIAGMIPAGYNGTFTVTAVTGLIVSYALAVNPGTYVAGGTLGPPGSNYGYSAYDFDESSIADDAQGVSTLKITQRRVLDSPNSISTNFQDQDNQFVVDSMTELDPTDVARAGQTVVGGVAVDGINSFDQGQRIFETRFAETYRGNPRGDSGGTMVFQFQSSQKIVHLQLGQICRFSYQQLNLSLQTVRVIALQPAANFESTKITLQWHEDAWYLDTYGQQGSPIYSTNNKQLLSRPPFPWNPFTAQPLAGDPIYDPSDWTFGLAQVYATAQGGTPTANMQITGIMPINSFATLQSPLIGLQGTTATSGSAYLDAAQILYAVVCAYDGSSPAKFAPPQVIPCSIGIPAGSNDNQITIPVAFWPPGTVGWNLYVGPNSSTMTLQATGTGTPSSITFNGFSPNESEGTIDGTVVVSGASSLNISLLGPPDVNFDHVSVRVKKQIHGGVFGREIDVVTATTIQFLGATWSTNQWAGYDFSITYSESTSGGSPQPILNFRVGSNTADTLTIDFLASGITGSDITALGVAVGDVLVMRAKPTTCTALTLGDANFVNETTPSQPGTEVGLAVNEGSYVLRIFAGTGAGQWRNVVSNTATVYTVDQPFNPVPDSTSRFWIEEAMWQPGVNSSSQQNSNYTGMFAGIIPIPNYAGESIVVQALTMDSNNNPCFEQYAPIRDLYIFGAGGTLAVTASGSQT